RLSFGVDDQSADAANRSSASSQAITVPMARAGVFETRLPIYEPGDYRIRVVDPITQETHEARFSIADLSAERRVATRDASLQKAIAATTPGGRACEFDEMSGLLQDFDPPRRKMTTTDVVSLWDTWLVFGFVIGLLLTEWIVRKAVHLA